MPIEPEVMPPESDSATESDTVVCEGCSTTIEREDAVTFGGDSFCRDCHDERFGMCDDCENTYQRDGLSATTNNHYVCRACIRRNYFTCADCDSIYHDDQNAGVTYSGYICNGCRESYFYCEGCDTLIHEDDYSGDNDLCRSCHDAQDNGVIRDYSDKAPSQKYGKGPHYYGVELEVETRNGRHDAAQSTLELLSESFVICKDDGSLNEGFEIVTAPASLSEQIERWKPFFSSQPSGLSSYSTSTCGLHVHCSRRPLSPLTIGRILVFVNSPEHRRFMECIASRKANDWAKYKGKALTSGLRYPEERYEAVNLSNHDTIEFRIFKGTLKQASFYKAIEFCDALIRFCMSDAVGITRWQNTVDNDFVATFCQYVQAQRKTYPHLWGFLSARWLGIETTEAKRYAYKPKGLQNVSGNSQTEG